MYFAYTYYFNYSLCVFFVLKSLILGETPAISARNPIVFKDLQARLRDLEAQLARRRAQHPKMLAAPW